ncbi:kinase-like domain-containing protein [Flagelloscypha sp. PMI_526]|nr:kinase-like domain-containing protein [Flagelloscypha sp. PMI_526]
MLERVAGRLGSRFGRSKPDITHGSHHSQHHHPDIPRDAHGGGTSRRESLATSLHTAYPSDYQHLQPHLEDAVPTIPESMYSGSEFTPSLAQSTVDSVGVNNPARSRGRYKLDDFIIQRTLGTGSFGRVHLVRSKHNLRFYAIKVMNKQRIVALKQVEHTNNEQRILTSIEHPFIVTLWGIFQCSTYLYMVMDFVPGGELFMLLRRSGTFPDPVAKFYAAEVACALRFLHEHGIIYRDLKPENILLNADGHIKVADFGFAKQAVDFTYTLCGTPDYLAPEIIKQSAYNHSVDWYALGVLIFEMLCGMPPFHEQTDLPPHEYQISLYDRISKGITHVHMPNHMNRNAIDLIRNLMHIDPTRRFGNLSNQHFDVYFHPWFNEVDWDRLSQREITAPYLPRINGDGDASAFDVYPEGDILSEYGRTDLYDPHGMAFPDFEYTAPQTTLYPY